MICPHCSDSLISKWRRHTIGEYILYFFYIIPVNCFRWVFPRLYCESCKAAISVGELTRFDKPTAMIKRAVGSLLLLVPLVLLALLIVSAYR